jgi:hypothetical protein
VAALPLGVLGEFQPLARQLEGKTPELAIADAARQLPALGRVGAEIIGPRLHVALFFDLVPDAPSPSDGLKTSAVAEPADVTPVTQMPVFDLHRRVARKKMGTLPQGFIDPFNRTVQPVAGTALQR